MLPNNSLGIITNNVKGIQSSKIRLKLIQYFKNKTSQTKIESLRLALITRAFSKLL